MENYTPEVFIAGTVPHGGCPPHEVAYHNSAAALDDEDIKIITTHDDKNVYFLAAHCKDFIGKNGCGTSLGESLPNTSGHRGDGLYVLDIGAMYACVAKSGDVLKSFVAKKGDAEKYAEKNGLAVYLCEDKLSKWEGCRTYITAKSRKIAQKSLTIGSISAVLLIIFWILSVSTSAYLSNRNNGVEKQIMEDIKKASLLLNENTVSPADNYLNEIQKIGSAAKKNKGVLDIYRVENGESKWVLKLPEWVAASEYSTLGGSLHVENIEGKIVVRKGRN